MTVRLAGAFAALLVLCSANASWAGKVGPEFRVNKYTIGSQGTPVVAVLADGGFLVSWLSNDEDGSNNGVFAQRYDAAGKRAGKRGFQVNKTWEGAQYNPSVAGLPDGSFVIVWASVFQDGSSYGVFGQRYDAAGKHVGNREFKVNKTTLESQDQPSIAALADGGFIVTWASDDQDGSGTGIYAQRYDAAGKRIGPREFQVNETTDSNQRRPSVAGLADGGFIITWESNGQDGSGYGIFGQRYDAAGNLVGNREFKVNKYTDLLQYDSSVAGLEDGGFVVLWTSDFQDGSNYGIFGQRYDAAGKRVGKRDFMVNKTTTSYQFYPAVSSLPGGGFVATWASYDVDGNDTAVVGQRYNAAGKRVGNREFQVNSYTASGQTTPSVAGLPGDGFVVTWSSAGQDGDSNGIYGQRYAP